MSGPNSTSDPASNPAGGAAANHVTSLRMSEAEKKDLIRAINQHHSNPQHAAARKAARYELPAGCSVLATIVQLGGGTKQSVLTVRDISNSGIGFLHPHYLSIGTKLNLVFVGADRQPMIRVEAVVKRCVHARGMAHDVGAQFAHTIDLVQMLGLDEQKESGGADRAGDHADAANLPSALRPLVAQLIDAVAASKDHAQAESVLRSAISTLGSSS